MCLALHIRLPVGGRPPGLLMRWQVVGERLVFACSEEYQKTTFPICMIAGEGGFLMKEYMMNARGISPECGSVRAAKLRSSFLHSDRRRGLGPRR